MIAVGVIIAVVAFGAIYASGYFGQQPSSGTQTWSQWGMSIQYPAGLKAQTQGLFEQQARNRRRGIRHDPRDSLESFDRPGLQAL
jgi:hypothetical protein